MGMQSQSPREGDVATKSTRGHPTLDRKSRDTKFTKERQYKLNPRAGTPSQPKVWGRQGNPRVETPGQLREKGTGHQFNPRRQGGDTKCIETGRLGGK